MLIELIRHGVTDLQLDHKYQGWTDAPLGDYGKAHLAEASDVANEASGMQRRVVHVTPLIRTRETAAILFPEAQQIPMEDLKEMNFGAFEGLSYQEISESPLAAAYQEWVDGICEGKCPGGESKAEFQERVCSAFELLMYDICGAGETELTIVAHGGTLMSILDRYAEPARPYFDWHTESGHGFLLDTAPWDAQHKLTLIAETDYTKGVN